ncbi:PQQ-binding-like beta-propeller repeat protein [Haloplanus salinarum]|uniref:outer membrane protein assembly factor BamB family protein n=1 Tax=Haloplanus salinarum TaxID=1912324 RepID=UPI00214AF208|nr:PQQ-binding-like beta-propeller repeat protein [Haloplanus salinarum]
MEKGEIVGSLTRRGVVRTVGVAVGGVLASGTSGVGSGQSAEAWPRFGYENANTRHAPANTAPMRSVGERWRFATGAPVVSSPAVVDGTVYVGRGNSNLYALDADSGEERWRFETGDAVNSPPAVVDGTVYVGSDDANLYALDADSGEERWRFETGDGVFSSPAVVDGTVYVGSDDANLYALDTGSGEERWRFEAGNAVNSSPAVVDGTVYVGSADTNLYALDATSGEERWRFGTEGVVLSSPAVADGAVYFGSLNGTLYALDATSGEERWQLGMESTVIASPAVADGTVYVGRISPENSVYAVDAASGEIRWRSLDGQVRSSPAVVDGTVHVGIRNGDTGVYALDAASGEERWRFETEGSVRSSPAVAGGRVYFGSDDAVYALSEGEATPTSAADPTSTTTPTRTTPPPADPSDGDGDGSTEGGDSDVPLLPLAGVGAAGAGAGGLWYWKRRGSDGPGTEGNATLAGGSTPDHQPASPASGDGTSTDVPERPDGAPDRIPQAPEVSVEYDALTDEEPLGGGGNADVAKATLPTPDGDVILAIKRPRMQGTLHTDAVDRLMEEAETWDKIDDHDHVVGVVDYGASPVPWIAMEYMDAGDLGDRAGELEFDRALWTALGITEGVHHAHRRGVAHLDLKPENVLFRSVEDAWDVPKVADWGLSKHLLDHSKSIEGLSPQYAAPEQFDEQYGNPDDITDIYQLGAVLYELFTGRPPFEGRPSKAMRRVLDEEPTPPSDVADVPQALDRVLLTALAKEKSERYETVLYLRDALRELGE